MNDLVIGKQFSLTPSTLDEAMKLSELIAESQICPQAYKGKPGDVLVCVQMGAEVGLGPMVSLQNIAVINGLPSVWGDAALALCQNHPLWEASEEYFDEETRAAVCRVKRRGEPWHEVRFSEADAKQAGLLSKDTYKKYLKRMLQMRARAFALRDKFADALKGLSVVEEVRDYEIKDITPPERVNSCSSALNKIANEPEPGDQKAYSDFSLSLSLAGDLAELDKLGGEISENLILSEQSKESLRLEYKNAREHLKI